MILESIEAKTYQIKMLASIQTQQNDQRCNKHVTHN